MPTIGERVIEWLGGVTSSRLKAETSRAYEAGWYDANDEPPSGDIKSYGYRHFAEHGRTAAVDHGQMLQTAWSLWQSSPTAKRAMTLKRDHIIGKNAMPVTEDEGLQAILDKFWRRNSIKKRARQFALQLFLFGDQCFPVFVRNVDGAVSQGYIDPQEIERVITHPDNALEKWAVVLRESVSVDDWRSGRKRQVLRIIREEPVSVMVDGELEQTTHPGLLVTADQAILEKWELDMLQSYGLSAYSGSCFYTAVNAVSNQDRGWSDLLQVADWIDQGDEVLFGLADREQMAGYFVWDVTLTGADDARVGARKRQILMDPPRKGSILVHNDAEKWSLITPNLGQAGTLATYDNIMTMVMGGLGFPRHWFGHGDQTNRATAYAQADPTEKSLEHDQGIVEDMLLEFCRFQRDQSLIAGDWTPEEDGDKETLITITLPDINPTNLIEITSMLPPLATALTAAIEQGWMRKETAVRVWTRALKEYGVETRLDEELEEGGYGDEDEEAAVQEVYARALNGLYAMAEGAGVAS